MITIDKNAWHYKLFDSVHSTEEPTNLCKYVRYTMGALAIWVLAGILLILAGLFTTAPLMYAFGIVEGAFVPMLALVFDGWLLITTLRFWKERGYIPDNALTRDVHVLPPPNKEKRPNIIWEYLVAIKQKTCPLIEVK